MKASEEIVTIIQRKLEGILEPKEAQILDRWLELPENASDYADYISIWEGTDALAAKKNDFVPNSTKAWADIEGQIVPDQPKPRFKTVYAIAASIALILMVLGVSSIFPSNNDTIQLVLQTNEKDTLLFSDGSKAFLFGPCTITYPQDFDTKERMISMNGFAYFDIVHDPKRPFEVNTEKGTVEVLGTSFTVDTRRDNVFAVQCVSGKVRVRTTDDVKEFEAVLTRNLKAEYRNQDQEITVSSFATSDVGIDIPLPNMIFENQPLGEILKRIEYSYGVSIQMENQLLLGTKYSTTIIDNTLDDFLNELKVTYKVDVVQTSSSNYILKGGASN